jgi:hypothetical protein
VGLRGTNTRGIKKYILSSSWIRKDRPAHSSRERPNRDIKQTEWAKEVITQEELKNMFSDKDKYENTAWNIAAGY